MVEMYRSWKGETRYVHRLPVDPDSKTRGGSCEISVCSGWPGVGIDPDWQSLMSAERCFKVAPEALCANASNRGFTAEKMPVI